MNFPPQCEGIQHQAWSKHLPTFTIAPPSLLLTKDTGEYLPLSRSLLPLVLQHCFGDIRFCGVEAAII
jgi:hypothetical protein